MAAHADRVQVSAISAGATLYPKAPQRGSRTFQAIADYPYAERLRRRTPHTAVVELAVSGGVGDIAGHVVDQYQANGQALGRADIGR